MAPSHISGLASWAEASNLADIVVDQDRLFDTENGAIGTDRGANADPEVYEVQGGIGFVQQHQTDGPSVGIWTFASLEISNAVVRFDGQSSAILLTLGDLYVGSAGFINASAAGVEPGPGGAPGARLFSDGRGCAGGISSNSNGGGGGFGSSGGSGGAGAAGGSAGACDANLEVLFGGSSGAGGEDSNSESDARFGGGGGGAVQLTALGVLAIDGGIHVGGGGARASVGNWRSGSGGGSGGAIFLEAPEIILGDTAALFANGGGGASSSNCSTPGTDGSAGLAPAPGGGCANARGGDGAAGSTLATAGASENEGQPSAGGGGGGTGRVVFNLHADGEPIISTSALSPPESAPAFVVLHTLDLP